MLSGPGVFHHVIRTVARTDTALFEQPDNLEFSNFPLSGEGVWCRFIKRSQREKET